MTGKDRPPPAAPPDNAAEGTEVPIGLPVSEQEFEALKRRARRAGRPSEQAQQDKADDDDQF